MDRFHGYTLIYFTIVLNMILFFGDIHGDFRHLSPVVKEHKPSAIILLGDIQAQQPLEKELAAIMELTEIYWIQGNHDTDSKKDYDNLFNSGLSERNLHGKIIEIDGVLVAGLGGIFREKIWWPEPVDSEPEHVSFEDLERYLDSELAYHNISEAKRNGELMKHRSTIFWSDWMDLYGRQADILVTHEAPSCHPHGFQAIDILAQSIKVKSAFHGHHHDCLDYTTRNQKLGFNAFGVGLRGVTDVHGNVIRPGTLDEKRMYRMKQV